MKVASIVGARPNFIKLSPVSRELRKKMDEIIIHTGQHYDYEMNKIFFDELGIPTPDFHLEVGSGFHGYQTGEMLKRIEKILIKEKPDVVLVFGDTNTTLAGAIAAAKLSLKVAHVEAGLRSFDRKMPEEVNRILVDHCSSLLFCPTETAELNLKKEGIIENVYLTGDVMVDAQRTCMIIAQDRSKIMDELSLMPKSYYLATVHRASNTDDPDNLRSIALALSKIGNVIFPCHPRAEKRLKELELWDILNKNTRVIKPVGYLDMLILEKNALKIITDSGGVQKEAYLLGVPCITLREETEWIETVQDGWNVLVGANEEMITRMARVFVPPGRYKNVFGLGDASQKIVKLIERII
ncbi:MAG: UDP-N-acetylglucosamine 2-epimerase (non-hydrolyzing) [Methanotrichaceae archaeon]|nr:UDP-N-acetylglucosamine 2-epimerase (non-hydrolyzing) [Methanotrichaceae archaeon]